MSMKDMMPSFELYQPNSIDNALELMDRFGDDGWVLAGGQDSYDWFKARPTSSGPWASPRLT